MEYEVHALRYASRAARRADHFIGGDPHDGPMPMDYFVWVIRGHGRVVLVDCGFNAAVAARRGRTLLRCPIESLGLLGIAPEEVQDVVLTHLHYDHVGNLALLPSARFHVQEAEVLYAAGRHMRHAHLRSAFEVEDVVGLLRLHYAGRVSMHAGVAAPWPGISLHPAPGHSPGLQYVLVAARGGPLALASDVSHFYENMASGRPFPIVVDAPGMLSGMEEVQRAAPGRVVPGHDPLVMARYPASGPGLEGIAVRLDDGGTE